MAELSGSVRSGDDIGIIMAGSPYRPTQAEGTSASRVNEVVRQLQADPDGFWANQTDLVMLDANDPYKVLDGHHRVIASHIAGTQIPQANIFRGISLPGFPAVPWADVVLGL